MVGELAYFIGLLGDSLSVEDIIGFLVECSILTFEDPLSDPDSDCDFAYGDRLVDSVVRGEDDSTIYSI